MGGAATTEPEPFPLCMRVPRKPAPCEVRLWRSGVREAPPNTLLVFIMGLLATFFRDRA